MKNINLNPSNPTSAKYKQYATEEAGAWANDGHKASTHGRPPPWFAEGYTFYGAVAGSGGYGDGDIQSNRAAIALGLKSKVAKSPTVPRCINIVQWIADFYLLEAIITQVPNKKKLYVPHIQRRSGTRPRAQRSATRPPRTGRHQPARHANAVRSDLHAHTRPAPVHVLGVRR